VRCNNMHFVWLRGGGGGGRASKALAPRQRLKQPGGATTVHEQPADQAWRAAC
jgi:hypothetical protein